MGQEQPQEFYDTLYTAGGANKSYHKHYSDCNYYGVWKAVVEKLIALSPTHILDVGCGPGQFAQMAMDRLNPLPRYVGIDFSEVAIAMARENCPEAQFIQHDLINAPFPANPYDCIVCLEVLEHIHEDLGVLTKMREQTPIIFSVPSFDSAGHVRFFQDEDGVCERYSQHVAIEEVTSTLVENSSDVIFIVSGKLRNNP